MPSRSTLAEAVHITTASGARPLKYLAGAILVAVMSACAGQVPEGLGPTAHGTLGPCPGTPNCVHTGLRHPAGTKGLYLAGRIPPAELIPRVFAVVESMPRTTIVEQTDVYLHAEVRSRIFRFVDDLELYITPELELVVRSASRVGKGDMSVNAERVADLRSRLEAAGLLN